MSGQDKDEAAWREQLTAEEFFVLREKGTERAFTGEYWNVWEEGAYHCRGCGELLFQSDTKFDAGCGWPATTGIELGIRLKQQLTTATAVIGALFPNIPVFAGEGALGALLTEHKKLLGGQLLPPRGFIFVLPGHHHSLTRMLLSNPIALRQRGGHRAAAERLGLKVASE